MHALRDVDLTRWRSARSALPASAETGSRQESTPMASFRGVEEPERKAVGSPFPARNTPKLVPSPLHALRHSGDLSRTFRYFTNLNVAENIAMGQHLGGFRASPAGPRCAAGPPWPRWRRSALNSMTGYESLRSSALPDVSSSRSAVHWRRMPSFSSWVWMPKQHR